MYIHYIANSVLEVNFKRVSNSYQYQGSKTFEYSIGETPNLYRSFQNKPFDLHYKFKIIVKYSYHRAALK